ncbi:MAG: S8 family serine peptidase [Chitinophagales bacterium]
MKLKSIFQISILSSLLLFACKDDDVILLDTTLPQALERSLIQSDLPYELDGFGGAYNPRQIVVKFRDGVSQATRNDILINTLGAVSVKECMCGDVLTLAQWDNAGLAEKGGLEGIKQKGTSENDIEELSFNYYNFSDVLIFTPPVIIGNPFYNQTDEGNIIAVLDVGVDYGSNTIIAGRLLGNSAEDDPNTDQDGNCLIGDQIGWDFFNEDNDPTDDHGHGTHVTNTIINEMATLDATGQLNEFLFLPIKTHNEDGIGTLFTVSCGIIYAADRGADIINTSWGFYSKEVPDVLQKAIEYANSVSGAIIVASVGNEGVNLDRHNHYPSDFPFDYVIPVGSSDREDTLKAEFSNYYGEQTTNLFAPGIDVSATMPIWYTPNPEIKSGTSMSAAAISAAVAFSIQQCGTNDVSTIRAEILNGLSVNTATYNGDNISYVNYKTSNFNPCP